ncbi:MAG: hypothetical protein ACLP0J_05395 [Solirubrobacteraceae bacterium]
MSAAATPELAIPSSRIAGVVDRAIDIAAKLTRPVFLDVESVPSRGPFVLVGNHQLLGMQDLLYLVRGLEVLRGVPVRGLADHFHFAVPLWRRWLADSGAVPGTRQNCAALLAAGEPVLVAAAWQRRGSDACEAATRLRIHTQEGPMQAHDSNSERVSV